MPTCDNCHIETDSYKPYLSSWGSIILCEKCRNDLSDYYKDMEVCKDSKKGEGEARKMKPHEYHTWCRYHWPMVKAGDSTFYYSFWEFSPTPGLEYEYMLENGQKGLFEIIEEESENEKEVEPEWEPLRKGGEIT